MMQSEKDLADLSALNARFIHNFVTCDVRSHDAIIHPRFVSILPSGAIQNRADYLTDWATDFDPAIIPYWDMRAQNITVFGDVALVRAVNKWTRRRDGEEVTGMTMYTDTYLRTEARWLCIQAQIQSITPDNYPGDETIICRYINGKRLD